MKTALIIIGLMLAIGAEPIFASATGVAMVAAGLLWMGGEYE